MNIPQRTVGAIAVVRGRDDGGIIRGTVKFYQMCGGILVVADISGLPTGGFHGFHIHEGDSCTGDAFADTGSHYNPTAALHPLHAGDLPPLLSAGGRAYMQVLTDRFSMQDIIGRTVVVHGNPDDFHTQPGGNAGTKIACGMIERR